MAAMVNNDRFRCSGTEQTAFSLRSLRPWCPRGDHCSGVRAGSRQSETATGDGELLPKQSCTARFAERLCERRRPEPQVHAERRGPLQQPVSILESVLPNRWGSSKRLASVEPVSRARSSTEASPPGFRAAMPIAGSSELHVATRRTDYSRARRAWPVSPSGWVGTDPAAGSSASAMMDPRSTALQLLGLRFNGGGNRCRGWTGAVAEA